jgi:hypothetical protein
VKALQKVKGSCFDNGTTALDCYESAGFEKITKNKELLSNIANTGCWRRIKGNGFFR